MHELALSRSILQAALDAALNHDAKRVKSIRLLINGHSCLKPESLDFHFQSLSAGTIAEGAKLEFGTVVTDAKCLKCGIEWPASDAECPNCGELALGLIHDEELTVESIEID